MEPLEEVPRKQVVNRANGKILGEKEELGGNYFDCTGYDQSDRFMKPSQKIADHIGQDYKGGGLTQTELMTQTIVIIPTPTRPIGVSVTSADGLTTITTTSVIIRAQKKSLTIRQIISQRIAKRFFRSYYSSVLNQCMLRSRLTVIAK
jgi:hypothetical protein